MIKLAKKKKAEIKEGKAVASAAGPGGVLTSFQEGIQQLTDGVGRALQGEVKLGNAVARIEQKQGGYLLTLDDGAQLDAEIVVSAVPAYAIANVLGSTNEKAAGLLKEIPYATMNVVCFGYQRERLAHDLNGFGYLIPKAEGRSTLGTLWDSSIFPNRAPEGQVLLRSMMGGATNMGAIDLSDEDVEKKTRDDLWQIMGIAAKPDFVRIFRHSNAIPQYVRGHAARVESIESALQAQPGLFLTGNAFFGVGLNDCVNASNLTAEKVIKELQGRA